jgi:hypothetical protein
LRDFFRTRPVFQLQKRLPLHLDVRRLLPELKLERFGVEQRDDLPGFDEVTFLGSQFLYPSAALECE